MSESFFSTGLKNANGEVTVFEELGECFMALHDHEGYQKVSISRSLYTALKREFA